ncbi:MAG: hypothetical protein NC912_05535 [Candidatus Omnitrophica bacterium]|nr:hypothetical protein [Candidatus Omnitrophota bacterium]
MDKLNLPIVKEPVPGPKWLCMDKYLEFVHFNLRYTVDKKQNRLLKKRLYVNVPFSLK